jgi:hypothetical protein
VHRQGELDACQRLLDQSRGQLQGLAAETARLQSDNDRHRVQASVEGVAGVSALRLIEHFAGVASLQADRIRQLGNALAGQGGFTLGGLGNALGAAAGGPLPEAHAAAASADGHSDRGGGSWKLRSEAWVRHWATLEAHVLAKQNAHLKRDAERAAEAHAHEAAALQAALGRANDEVAEERNPTRCLCLLLVFGMDLTRRKCTPRLLLLLLLLHDVVCSFLSLHVCACGICV